MLKVFIVESGGETTLKLKASKKRTKLKLKLNRQEDGNNLVLMVSKERTGRVDQMTHDDFSGGDNGRDGDGDDGDCLEGRRLARLATD